MSKQVLDRKQMQHLQKLGVNTSNASMALIYENKYGDVIDWEIVDDDIHEFHIGEYNPYLRSKYGAFTLQDVLNLLPGSIYLTNINEEFWLEFGASEPDKSIWYVQYRSVTNNTYKVIQNNDLIDAAYEMLCWCIEEKFVEN